MTQCKAHHLKQEENWIKHLKLTTSTPKLEIPLILGGTGLPGLLHVHVVGSLWLAVKTDYLSFLGISNWIEWSAIDGV